MSESLAWADPNWYKGVATQGRKPSMGRSQIGIEGWQLRGESLACADPNLCNYEDHIPGFKMPSIGHPLLPMISWSYVSHAL